MSLLHHNFGGEYDLSFSAWGDGILCEGDLLDSQKPSRVFEEFTEKYGRFPNSISLLIEDSAAHGLDYGFTGVDTAMLETFEMLKELILPDTLKRIDLTPKLADMLKKNDTLIRGTFGSYAENFARGNGLHFRPADYVFARHTFEAAQETTVMALVFHRNGSVEITEDISSPGSSAGNTFGGTFRYPLPTDFYETMDVERITDGFRQVMYEKTVSQGKLAAFLKKAKSRGYYTGAN